MSYSKINVFRSGKLMISPIRKWVNFLGKFTNETGAETVGRKKKKKKLQTEIQWYQPTPRCRRLVSEKRGFALRWRQRHYRRRVRFLLPLPTPSSVFPALISARTHAPAPFSFMNVMCFFANSGRFLGW